ncbi:MAG TPA: reverse transcriptase domain-containing protein [Planctomycetota bacterium]
MGLGSVEELLSFAATMESHFKPPRKRLIKGKWREIDALYPRPKKLLRRLHRFLQRRFRPHPAVHGGAIGRSCFSSARCHLRKRFVVTRDVSNCYPSICTENLCAYLSNMGFAKAVAELLAHLMTVRGRVPQGSPISADALNLLLQDADQEIASIAGRLGLSYSRTYDDMILSGNDPQQNAYAASLLESVIAAHGLEVNKKKVKKNGYQPHSREQLVHGLVVNTGMGVRVNKEYRERARLKAESYVRAARVVSADSIRGVAKKRQIVVGHLQHCRQAAFSPARHIHRCVKTGDRLVERRLASLGLAAHRLNWWLMSVKNNNPSRIAALWTRIEQ